MSPKLRWERQRPRWHRRSGLAEGGLGAPIHSGHILSKQVPCSATQANIPSLTYGQMAISPLIKFPKLLRDFPERVDGFDKNFGPVGWGKKDPATSRLFHHKTSLVQSFHMLHGSGLVDSAFSCNFVHAKRRGANEQPYDFNTAVVCQPRYHSCPATID